MLAHYFCTIKCTVITLISYFAWRLLYYIWSAACCTARLNIYSVPGRLLQINVACCSSLFEVLKYWYKTQHYTYFPIIAVMPSVIRGDMRHQQEFIYPVSYMDIWMGRYWSSRLWSTIRYINTPSVIIKLRFSTNLTWAAESVFSTRANPGLTSRRNEHHKFKFGIEKTLVLDWKSEVSIGRFPRADISESI